MLCVDRPQEEKDMSSEYTPGDLGVRIAFTRSFGLSEGSRQVHPTIEIRDQTSGKTLEIELTAEQLAAVLSGSEAQVPALRVTGFKGVAQWGKYHKSVSQGVKMAADDYRVEGDAIRKLPHVAQVIAQMEADGYTVERPRQNNARMWVIIGRRYDDQP
jgi:hypothetical protein